MPLSRSLLCSVLACVLLPLVLSPAALAQAPARTVSNTVPLAADGEVKVGNHEGSITVSTWDRDQVQYEAEIMPTDEDPNAEKVTIQSRVTNDRLRLATKHEEGDDESVVFGFDEDGFRWGGINIPAVHYTIKMPRTASLVLDDHESTIDVTGLAGDLRIDTHEGRISVAEQRGSVTIDSHESPISIADQTGDVRIDTHEGRMELRRVTGRLSVETHDGDLTARKVDGGLRFESHDGAARVSFTSLSHSVSANTHDGDVTMTLPPNAGFDLDTDFDDDVDLRSGFDLRPIRIADDEDDDEVNYRGDVNGGGPEIHLESQDGDFVIRTAGPSPSDSGPSSAQQGR
ncbi:MAG: DUF4097 family beta strand repeat-containing protein [Salinibacter sp.]|uniref:DUF4097 family beta strand repeat-containing protein n=1 Tax=Salinibacter sp. TaxID=2065818 RepID=UPI0035D4443D